MKKELLSFQKRKCSLAMVVVWFWVVPVALKAQQSVASNPASGSSTTASATSASTVARSSSFAVSPSDKTDNRYRIGPHDVLSIIFYNRPMLSRDAVRVNDDGMIRVPMIDEDIPAACLTENELAVEISKRYLKYFKNPHIEVFIKDYASQPVAVIGAVNKPQQFKLQRRVRLLELLAYAEGPSEKAGRTIKIVHNDSAFTCQKTTDITNTSAGLVSSIRLKDILSGDEKANPYVQPGDVVFLPDAEQVYVVGNVQKPTAIPLKDDQGGMTFLRAIAVAGGPLPTAKTDKVKLIRRVGESGKQEIVVDYIAIQKNKAPDITLQPDDIIDVGESGTKVFGRTLLQGIGGSILNLPVRLVP
jgi:polysaccharide export outer membrane protein